VPPIHNSILDDADKKMIEEFSNTKTKAENLLEQFKFREALYEVIDLARKGNKYMQDKQPWIVAKQMMDNGLPTTEAQQVVYNYVPILPFLSIRFCHLLPGK
jgi:methionyl-tRNA synthetase